MASSSCADVIELGSSDEDTEPVPKKKKLLSKAMVHIPNELPGITIKPARPKVNPVSSIGEGVTVTKVFSRGASKVANPFANKNKLNGKPKIPSKPVIQPSRLNHILAANNVAVKIAPLIKKIVTTTPNLGPLKIAKGALTSTSTLPISKPLQSRLPPGITVKRTKKSTIPIKHGQKKNPAQNIQVRKQICPPGPKSSKPPEMVCVDLDDDDTPPSCAGPQWYLRPEDPEDNDSKEKTPDLEETHETETSTKEENTVKGTSDIEKQNNKEPPQFIEIVIEDSPSKPQKSKRYRNKTELAITIEDSPVKSTADKPAPSNSSDNETTTTDKDKQSKKKLAYPKTAKTMEIEIDFTQVEDNSKNHNVENSIDTHNADTEIVEIEESPLKPLESENTSTPKKKKPNPQPQLKLNVTKTTSVKSQPESSQSKTVASPSEPGEFNPTYQSFINLCFQFENSDDMSKIVEKKIKTYYRQVPKEYTESEAFVDIVASKISAMKAAPDKMYLYIKDVVDELNMQRKVAKAQPPILDVVSEDKEKILYGEESEFDLKRQRQIRKLEKTLKKLHRAIQKLEEQEVDFDDEEDSVYLLTESEDNTNEDNNQPLDKSELLKRYKERLIRVHAKFCQLTNTKMPSEPRVQIDAHPGQPKGAARRLEKWINKKVPIGTPLPFPDFHDVLRCVREANQEDKLCWNEADIMEEARDLFTRCGKKLQRRRQENEWRLAASRIQAELDPAEESEDLKKKLDQNRRVASAKESEVFNKFADRQNLLNLEAIEIGDKEANESPVETDEEEPTEEKTSLETKEKRKERLKRLLQEKSKKSTVEKEHSQEIEKVDIESEKESVPTKKEESTKDNENKEEIKRIEKESDPLAAEVNKDKSDTEKIHSLSDDSSKIDSDIDELHLLQKLHSDIVDSSTFESSESETQIDTISSSDSKKRDSDVISIENSSYSESEKNNESEIELVSYSRKRVITEIVDTEIEIECSVAGVQKKINKSNNDEYNESVEDILLASSDDDDDKDKEATNDPICVSEINVHQTEKQGTQCLIKENSEINADTIDASSMDSTEMTAVKNNNLYEMEITSISSTENGDGNIPNTNEAINVINSVESVQSIDVEPTKSDSNKIDSSESNHEQSNSVEDEPDEITSNSEKDSSSNSNDISENKKSLEDFTGAAEMEITSCSTENADGNIPNTNQAINSVESVQSVDIEPTKSDSMKNDSSESNYEKSNSVEDEADKIISNSEKDSSSNSNDISENKKSLEDFTEAKEKSVESAGAAAMSTKPDKDTSDNVSTEAKSSAENKTSRNEGEIEKSISKEEMESSIKNGDNETSNQKDVNVKTSSNEGENEKSLRQREMESSSNNDEKETSNKKDDNISESTIPRHKVEDSDAKAFLKGVASVEPMEVDINMDNT